MGSGTTQAVAKKLGRKWLGVEMGEQFYDVVLPRLKKVIFGKQSGISKNLKEKYKGGGFFKYYSLEQYADVLERAKYSEKQQDLWTADKKVFEEYIFATDEKFSHVLELVDNTININFEKLYKNIDFAETISNLLGISIKKITKESVVLADGSEYKTNYNAMSSDEKLAFVRLLKPLLWWGE